jgi:16S rRNA (guanine1207-N2)-methyltransferase
VRGTSDGTQEDTVDGGATSPSTAGDGTAADAVAARLAEVLAGLTPWPEDGSRADGPVAVDATDRLLLDEARPLLAGARPGDVVVLGDRFGALTLGALALGAPDVRLHTDAVTAEAAVRHHLVLAGEEARVAVHAELGPDVVRGARVVLLQLPSALAEVQEVAEQVARTAADDVVLLAGGRVKHMTRAMNDVLAAELSDVRATLARQKSRVLVASGVRPERRDAPPAFPTTATLADPALRAAAGTAGVTVAAHGGTFAGAALDHGTRFLLTTADRWPADVADAVDLGCGTGLLAAVLALRSPGARVVATDRSAAAVASARATARANGVADRVVVVRDDVGDGLADASADLVVLNPPFHDRTSVRTDTAHRMFAAAGRLLRPGGELWTVFNTPLRYRAALARAVGPTQHVAQDPRFTVTRSVRR